MPPPPPDDGAAPVDASFEDNAPPLPPIDSEVPPPDVVPDMVIVPPPRDASPPTCDATGPLISVVRVHAPTSEVVCAGQLAAHTFTHALCACGDLSLRSVGLQTGSFDSSAADKSVVQVGAPVGLRGNYPPVGSHIGGSLTVAGTASPMAIVAGGLEIEGDLRLAGNMTFGTFLSVRRDAWVVSKINFVSVATIYRNLYFVPPAGGVFGLGLRWVGGMEIGKTFTVDDPCGCEKGLNIAAMEMLGAEKTDNADRTALSNVTTATRRELSCGSFRFDAIGGTAPIELTVTGRTAIFVDGDVTASDSFVLAIAPGPNVEVDWFIRGNLSISAAARIGDPIRPSATRIYVAGTQDIQLSSGSIGANIYAPNTNISFLRAGTLSGAVYGKNLSMPEGAYIKYDRAILNEGNECDQPARCEDCRYCNGGAACINNTCGACATDEDCCAPLVCEPTLHVCQPLLTFR
jgi:hypothetical protein